MDKNKHYSMLCNVAMSVIILEPFETIRWRLVINYDSQHYELTGDYDQELTSQLLNNLTDG